MSPPSPAPTPARGQGLLANATLLMTLTTLFWGGNAVAGKFALGHISPLLLTALRWICASLILLVIAYPHLRRDWPVIRTRLPYLFALGAFGFTTFNALLYTSLKYTTAINVAILQAAMPMFIFALNFLVFRAHLHWSQALGYSVTLIGVLLTATHGNLGQLADLALNHGDLLMLVASVIYAGYSVALRARPAIHWLSFLAVLVFSALIVSLGFAAFEIATGGAIWPTTGQAWLVVLYTTIFASLLSQAFYARSIELIGPNRAALFLNLVPIFGSLLAVLLVGEVFHLHHALAIALVIGGIAIAQHLTPQSH